MSVPARIAALVLTLVLTGCSSQMIPGSSGPSASGGSGNSGSSGSGSGASSGSGSAVSTCGSGGSTNAAAYVYVSAGDSSSSNPQANFEIVGYSAAADGTLTPVPGSPFPTTGLMPLYTAGTGSTLFGADGYNIDSFQVQANGCLNPQGSVVAGQGSPTNPAFMPMNLSLDPQGADLYSFDYGLPDGFSDFGSWSFNTGTGGLTQVGANVGGAGNSGMLAFSSSHEYAVTSYCYDRGGEIVQEYQRTNSGALVRFGYGPLPTAASGSFYCPLGAAADGSNHIVIAMAPCQTEYLPCIASGPEQLAVYSVADSGKLSTASTWQNMTAVDSAPADGSVNYQFSPDDRYYAISSFTGLQLFAWDSATVTLTSIATVRSGGACSNTGTGGGCSGPRFGNVAWDQNDHLYTTLNQQLLVYSVSPSGLTPAPGSPYTLPSPAWVTVLPQNAQ